MTAACVLVRDASIFVLALCNTAANEGAVTSIGGGPLKSQCTLAPSHSGLYRGTRTSSAVSGCTPHYLHTSVTGVTAGTRGRYEPAPVFWWLCTLQRNVIRYLDTVRNGHIFIIYFVFGKISLKRIEIRIQWNDNFNVSHYVVTALTIVRNQKNYCSLHLHR